jgi:hypothetical protein
MRSITFVLLAALGSGTVACNRSEMRAEDRPARRANVVLSREEALRRFQLALAPVAQLESPHTSPDSLMSAFVKALGDRDTAALASMAVSPAEFGYLYYPTSPQGLPPYDLEPALMWHLLWQRSEQGIRRVLARYGGQRLQLLSHDCGRQSSREGGNTVVGPCVLKLRDSEGHPLSLGFPSQVIERGGRYKILSYANKL